MRWHQALKTGILWGMWTWRDIEKDSGIVKQTHRAKKTDGWSDRKTEFKRDPGKASCLHVSVLLLSQRLLRQDRNLESLRQTEALSGNRTKCPLVLSANWFVVLDWSFNIWRLVFGLMTWQWFICPDLLIYSKIHTLTLIPICYHEHVFMEACFCHGIKKINK